MGISSEKTLITNISIMDFEVAKTNKGGGTPLRPCWPWGLRLSQFEHRSVGRGWLYQPWFPGSLCRLLWNKLPCPADCQTSAHLRSTYLGLYPRHKYPHVACQSILPFCALTPYNLGNLPRRYHLKLRSCAYVCMHRCPRKPPVKEIQIDRTNILIATKLYLWFSTCDW